MTTEKEKALAEYLVRLCRAKRLGVIERDYDYDNSLHICTSAILDAFHAVCTERKQTV